MTEKKKKLSRAEFMKNLGKKANSSFASEEKSSGEIKTYYDTGCYMLNMILSGSIFKGMPPRVVALAGEEATGKTYIAMSIMENFLKRDDAAVVEVFDTESTMNKKNLSSRGIDTNRVLLSEQQTVEEFSAEAYKRLKELQAIEDDEKIPYMIVLDSLGGLSSIKKLTELEKKDDDFTKDMSKTGLLKEGMIAINKQAAIADVPVLVTNHVYVKIGAFTRPNMPPPKEMGGGSGLKYMASIILFLSKKPDYNEETKEYDGIKIIVHAQKSRFIKPFQKVELKLSFTTGLDKYYGLLGPAVEHGVVTERSAGNKGTVITFRDGREAKKADILENPEQYFTESFLKEFDEIVAPHYCFGSSVDDEFLEEAGE